MSEICRHCGDVFPTPAEIERREEKSQWPDGRCWDRVEHEILALQSDVRERDKSIAVLTADNGLLLNVERLVIDNRKKLDLLDRRLPRASFAVACVGYGFSLATLLWLIVHLPSKAAPESASPAPAASTPAAETSAPSSYVLGYRDGERAQADWCVFKSISLSLSDGEECRKACQLPAPASSTTPSSSSVR